MINSIQITGLPDNHPEHPIKDIGQLARGDIDISSLKVKGHCTRIFDLMKEEDREAYDSTYVELADLSRQGKILITSNSRETLTRSDGSTGWFRHLEWTTFDTSEILGA